MKGEIAPCWYYRRGAVSKTIVFSKIAADMVRKGERVLILAHRGELLEQAQDKLFKTTGLKTSLEKADSTSLNEFYRVTVGSVQTLMRPSRLNKFSKDHFKTIVVDEAHHCLSDSYQAILSHFDGAKVLGVTATPDRGDLRNLGEYFDSLAYEYTLPSAIHDGYLSPIKAMTIPLKIDLNGVSVQNGDFKTGDLGHALDPYLEQIATEMEKYCMERKTVVFLPLVATSQKFAEILNNHGFKAKEVNGTSDDRHEALEDFESGKYNVLCNSMLLTEGWDCPSVDCIIVLRPTKVRSLYCLDEETEVLTKSGWKRNVCVGEEIAALDIETNQIVFRPTLATVRRPIDEDEFFCSIKGQSSDIRVTNKHRMIYDNKRHKGWKITTAEKLSNLRDGAYVPVSGNTHFKGVPLSDDEIRFIGWVMTDGCINKANNAIQITQNCNQPWIEEIQKAIDSCNLKHNRIVVKHNSQFNSSAKKTIWTISKGKPRGRDKDKRGWGYLEPFISKNISDQLFEMNEQQFDTFLEAIHLADGQKQNGQSWTRRSYHIGKGNKSFIERLQIMALMRGYRANISIETKGRDKPFYILHLKKQNFVKIGSIWDKHATWIKEAYKPESCWCVENELGTIVTRRHGKVAILGNCQMVGRGTRLSPGKDHLLLLDFLWHTERHELCHPAVLIADNDDVAKQMTQNMADQPGMTMDLEEAETKAQDDVVTRREEALAEQLKAMRKRKRKLVDPLQFEFSIQAQDLSNYVPAFANEMMPPTAKQLESLEKFGIYPDEIDNAGKASLLLDRLHKRMDAGLSTPKQIRFLESRGFLHVGMWSFEDARKMIARISMNNWMVPPSIDPATYEPTKG